MTGPIDANTKAYIDEQLFGIESLGLQDEIARLRLLVIQQRKAIVSNRIRGILYETAAIDYPDDPKKVEAATRAVRMLTQGGTWFNGAIQETNDPYRVYEEWLTKLRSSLDQYRPTLGQLVLPSDSLPPSVESDE